ncbi:MAG: arsenic resistance N-acetyltransferase ArsN2 [Acidobacteriota bacterium]|nr:arsenic resistance N-acetyltransferase ArsN2 [Acidobacteriota bacterium]
MSEDWPLVAALLGEAGLPEAGAADHLSQFVLAFSNGALVGCAGMEVYGRSGLLRSVAVAASDRGKGLGATLVGRVLDRARAQGVHEVILLTETALTYFPRFGFEPITRAEAPEAVTASVEFKGACCATAAVMRLRLG